MHEFRPFSLLHLATLVGIALATAVIIAVARRVRSPERLSIIDLALGVGALIIWMLQTGDKLLPSNFDARTMLPLEICDLAALIAPLALLVRARWLYALLYFWGLGLSSQGLFTPQLRGGPDTLAFWLFFFRHGAIVGGGIYIILVHDFHPAWRDWRTGVLAGLAYLALIFPLDIVLGANYGYVGNATPDQPSLIDYLGPWPQRAAIIVVIALAVLTVLELPWAIARAVRARAALRAAD